MACNGVDGLADLVRPRVRKRTVGTADNIYRRRWNSVASATNPPAPEGIEKPTVSRQALSPTLFSGVAP